MSRLTCFVFSFLAFAMTPAVAMTGDEGAISMARRMVEQMGGLEKWANANWIYAREDARFASQEGAVDSQFWRRTDAPGEWAHIKGDTLDVQWAWDANGGWIKTAEGVRDYSPEEMLNRLGWARGEIYIMYVRIARNDPNLHLVAKDERSFRILDARDGSDLGLYGVDSNGELTTWSFGFGDDSVDYVYGPLKRFGDISLPAWGALTNGNFRFHYTEISLSADAPDVSFDRP